jgi:hypothetical protein
MMAQPGRIGKHLEPPNGLRFTRAASLDRDERRDTPTFKMATILSPHSGVGWKRGLGRTGYAERVR